MRTRRLCLVLAALAAFSAPSLLAQALTSAPASLTLQASKPETLTVSAPSPGTVTFTLVGTGSSTAKDPGNSTVSWTTNWDLKPSRTAVAVCAYMTGALTGASTDTVPIAAVKVDPGVTGTFVALNATACGQSNAATVSSTTITAANRKNGSRNDSMALEIDESAITSPLTAGTYTGTLFIIAEATP